MPSFARRGVLGSDERGRRLAVGSGAVAVVPAVLPLLAVLPVSRSASGVRVSLPSDAVSQPMLLLAWELPTTAAALAAEGGAESASDDDDPFIVVVVAAAVAAAAAAAVAAAVLELLIGLCASPFPRNRALRSLWWGNAGGDRAVLKSHTATDNPG